MALAIVLADSQDCGVYGCSISNEYGSDTTDFLLSSDSKIQNIKCDISTSSSSSAVFMYLMGLFSFVVLAEILLRDDLEGTIFSYLYIKSAFLSFAINHCSHHPSGSVLLSWGGD